MFDEYNEVVLQYGYLALFAPAFSLAPLLALIDSICMIRIDAAKFCSVIRRPAWRECEDIGSWFTVLSVLGFTAVMVTLVVLMLFLGTLLDTASIILIVVPLFLPIVEPLGVSLVWFGIIVVIGAEIGLLTPPLGISCFVIKSTIDDPSITLKDVFLEIFDEFSWHRESNPKAAVLIHVSITLD